MIAALNIGVPKRSFTLVASVIASPNVSNLTAFPRSFVNETNKPFDSEISETIEVPDERRYLVVLIFKKIN
jgi:hypothetical protein